MNRNLFALFFSIVFCLMVQAVETPAEPDAIRTLKTHGDVQLSLHVFNPTGHQSADSRPAIVFFFGGGWVSGTPGQFFPHCRYLATRGMVAMSAEYRVRKRHGTPPSACVQDGKSAIRWVRQHARELGIDSQRIAAAGGSAGGHVAAATALSQGFEGPNEDNAVSSQPNALVLFNPVFDNGPGGYGHDRVVDYWCAFSPLHNIGPGAPPTIVFLGTKDKLIPVSTSNAYQKRMHGVGSRCDVHLYLDQTHGFFNHRKGENPYYFKTVWETDLFLASLGYLTGPPTLRK